MTTTTADHDHSLCWIHFVSAYAREQFQCHHILDPRKLTNSSEMELCPLNNQEKIRLAAQKHSKYESFDVPYLNFNVAQYVFIVICKRVFMYIGGELRFTTLPYPSTVKNENLGCKRPCSSYLAYFTNVEYHNNLTNEIHTIIILPDQLTMVETKLMYTFTGKKKDQLSVLQERS